MTRDRLYWEWVRRSGRPIFVGPWLSEVGFEALYWLPFVAHLQQRYTIPRERFIAISRGGASAWYDAGHQVELFDYLPPADLRLALLAAFQRQKSVKQLEVTALERRLLPYLAARLGIRRYHLLHPSRMYHALKPWWGSRMSMADLMAQLTYTPIHTPAIPPDLALPDKYVAVKFYERPTFPMTEDLKTWVQELITRVAQKAPVVLLNPGLQVDDHSDFPAPSGPNIVSLDGKLDPRNNLAVQSAIIAKAQAFVGTYGGTMQLAARLQVPAVGFFHEFRDTAYSHRLLTDYLGMVTHKPVFIGRPHDASFVGQVMSGL